MTRTFGCTMCIVISSIACSQSPEAQRREQRAELRELARTERTERADAVRAQAEARAAEQRVASGELIARTNDVNARQEDLAVANRDLAETTASACEGVGVPDECPLPMRFVRNSESIGANGTLLTLTNAAGTRESVERRIACYRARATLRSAPVAGACIADLADETVDVEVQDRDGAVAVVLTSEATAWSALFRDEVRRAIDRFRQTRRTGVTN